MALAPTPDRVDTAPHYLRFAQALALAAGVASGCAGAAAPATAQSPRPSVPPAATSVAAREPDHTTPGNPAACPTQVPREVVVLTPEVPHFPGHSYQSDPCTVPDTVCEYRGEGVSRYVGCRCLAADAGADRSWVCTVYYPAVGPLPPPDLAAEIDVGVGF
jgi:hypothetical protein